MNKRVINAINVERNWTKLVFVSIRNNVINALIKQEHIGLALKFKSRNRIHANMRIQYIKGRFIICNELKYGYQ